MKLHHLIILAGITAFISILSSCASDDHRYLYYYDTPSAVISGESIDLVSVQLSGRPISWTKSMGTVRTTYSIKFDDANSFARMIFSQNLLDGFNIAIPDSLEQDKTDLRKYVSHRSLIRPESYDFGVAIVDVYKDPTKMDEGILRFLNDHLSSDLYLVIDGDISKFYPATLAGGIPARAIYELSFVLYDRSGTKVLSLHHPVTIDFDSGESYDGDAYYRHLNDALELSKDKILEELHTALGE